MATVRKRFDPGTGKSLGWEFTHGRGKGRVRKLYPRKADAETYRTKFAQQRAMHGSDPENPELDEAIRKFEEHLHRDRRASSARRIIRVIRTFRLFLQMFHPSVKSLQDVRVSHIEDFKTQRLSGKVVEEVSDTEKERERELRRELKINPKSGSPQANAKYGWLGRKRLHPNVAKKTINYELRTLTAFFNWSMKKNYAVVNPAAGIETFKLPKKALPDYIEGDKLTKFFEAASCEERRKFGTILLTGMRRGELTYLAWEDLKFDLGVVLIQSKPDVWDPKTDERVIPISPMVEGMLAEQWKERRSDTWVFPNRAGNPDKHLLEKMKKICRKAGIEELNVHQLRHSFATILRMKGVALADIANLLGHKNLATTQIYANVQQEHLRTAINKLSGVIDPRAPHFCATNPKTATGGDGNLLSDGSL